MVISKTDTRELHFPSNAYFAEHYARVAGIIARVVRDRARAQELAVDVLLEEIPNVPAPGASRGL